MVTHSGGRTEDPLAVDEMKPYAGFEDDSR
jgi:hypothetical protein